MSRLFILFVLLLNFVTVGFTVAQTVDPCQFGCPKDGCPQCEGGGGPIENGDENDNNDSDDNADSNDDDDSDDDDSDGKSSGDVHP
jgi:hypothetical protein